jgi:hypothetical protein
MPPQEPGRPVAEAALPRPKAGLWSWSSQAAGQKRLCLSGQILSALAARPGCPQTRRVRNAIGAYVVETRCAAGSVRRTWAKSVGDYSRAFSVDVAIDDARAVVTDHQDYRYLGPCAPGQRPDDAG